MAKIVHSNAKILYLWRQEFLSSFLRCTVCISFNFFCQGEFCLAACVDTSLTLMNFKFFSEVSMQNLPGSIQHESSFLMRKYYIDLWRQEFLIRFMWCDVCTKSKFLQGKVLCSGTCWWVDYAIRGKWTFVLQSVAAKASLVLFGIKLVFLSVLITSICY